MPELTFVLPHWVYWCGLILFPLITMLLFRAGEKQSSPQKPVSLVLAYVLLMFGGFLGVHRLYLKSRWAFAFVFLFIAILFVNIEVRIARDAMSGADNKVMVTQFKIDRAEKNILKGKRNAEEKLQTALATMEEAKSEQAASVAEQDFWHSTSQALGLLVIALLLIDFFVIPGKVRQRNEVEQLPEDGFHCPVVEQEHSDADEPIAFSRWVSKINGLIGEFVAYWSLIAVVVYYYEVMARYMFNSPTNWAHEGMFLMFGMQYLLAGGFVLREGAHVRVDVVYTMLSNRGKAIVDLLTSVFFFIFMFTLMWTGWTFFMDSYNVNEVSFTEWGVHYWPIKFALPLGALLLVLQGIAQLINDVLIVIDPSIKQLDATTRPEG